MDSSNWLSNNGKQNKRTWVKDNQSTFQVRNCEIETEDIN